MKGRAYIFLRKDGAAIPGGFAGHVGWGFSLGADGPFYAGSTENPSGMPVVLPGGDNGWWGAEFPSEAAMIEAFGARQYDGFKWATVREPNLGAARAVAEHQQVEGYTGLRNNCLDHAYKILRAYGVDDLPWLQNHPAPSDWFAAFNGEYKNL
ncbi:MAG TPA: hypothetical protein VK191_10310 [Symbiobacteriaceae bacterium]|nr:hypothetical protein [Symbiobacteriaceae bacterium]